MDDVIDFERFGKNIHPAGFNLGEIEEAVDQVQEMFRANQNLLKILFLKSRYLPFGPPQHQAGEADNGIERRPQLVTDVGKKLRLVPVSGLKQRVLLLDFLKQADVFGGDHRLVGEGCDESDLLLGERLNPFPPNHDHADGDTFSEHGNTQQRSKPAGLLGFAPFILGVSQHVGDMNGPAFGNNPADEIFSAGRVDRVLFHKFFELRCGSVADRNGVNIPLEPVNVAFIRSTELGGVLDESFKDRLEIKSRAANNFQHLARSRLLIQRLSEFARAVFNFVLQVGVGLLELGRHAVELVGQLLQLVAGFDFQSMIEIAATDACRSASQNFDGPHHASTDQKTGPARHSKTGQKKDESSQGRSIKRSVGFAHRPLDKYGPAEILNWREGGKDLLPDEIGLSGQRPGLLR